MRLFWLAVLSCLLCVSTAYAQEKRTVTGVVSASDGTALSGATINEKGTANFAVTDGNGQFSIKVSPNAKLVVSYSGFTDKEVDATGDNISVVLESDGKALSEVVVTGFGFRKQTRKLSYSVAEVKGEEITRANNANLVNALQGKVAGVMINQGASGPQSSSRIRIRGNSSLNSNTQPLVVVDGVLIEPGTTGNDSWGENPDFGNIMKNLNPDDYESVTVLKGAAASALYGSKAQNGVLLITTKKGRQRKGLGVSLSHSQSYDKAYKLYDLQNQFGGGIYPEFTKDVNGNDIVDPNASIYVGGYSFGPAFDGRQIREIDGRMITWKANDPLDFFETGKFINTNLAVEGGNENTTFRFSYSNLYNTSVLPDNGLKRNNFAVRATQKIGRALTMDVSVNYSDTKSDNPARNGSRNNIDQAVYKNSIEYAQSVVDGIMAWSDKDGYKETRKLRRYNIQKGEGKWLPTAPGYMAAVEPYWNRMRTMALDSAAEYKPVPPPAFSKEKGTEFYQQAYDVYDIGKNMNTEQRDIALFWDCNPFYLNVQGHLNYATKKLSPGGHWISIASIAARKTSADLNTATAAYVLTAMALYDGFISCWDEKYRSHLIRPETYINSYIDEQWRPLLQTPPFPEYTSGHSVISTAAAVVLTYFFGDNFAFDDDTETPYGLPVRKFSSFNAAADEAAISRFYGGIHYKAAIENGQVQGRKVGEKVLKKIRLTASDAASLK